MSDQTLTAQNQNDNRAEEWRPVAGWESLYSISNRGRLLSFHNKAKPRILACPSNIYGYKQAVLSDGKRRETASVHKLVAATFIGPRPMGMHTNHIDGNKTNNRIENLEYCTPRQNAIHSVVLHGGNVIHENQHHSVYHLSKYGFGRLSCPKLAELYGVSVSQVNRAIHSHRRKLLAERAA